ncbi:helix-turn-helix domain-containing protein [uncultured Brevibacillus sp.]|uniref:helix-turn-helix domain-containing protein n=1 Tax=uncultured Brevibacillus sp. TaxID=169970 RepID=UPI002592E18F|nr:helix-turn-helix domain-containing protein [uncultured Brevibacillus sp.]
MIKSNRLFYTVPELAEMIPLGKNTLYRLVSQKDFPKLTVGKKILIPADELEKYLADKLYDKIAL